MLSVTPDSAVTTAGTPVKIDVLANDTGAGLVVTSFSNPANGSVVFNSGDKSFTYTPTAGFVGNDTFSYTVRDAQGTPATAEVTVSVVASGGATVAMDDSVEVVAGGSVTIPVLANDMTADGGELQLIAVSTPGHGVANILSDQRIRYVPQSGFVGIDSFTYTVLDGQGATASATVTVKVVAANSAPVAVADSFDVVADTTTVLAVLANDSDPNGGPLQIVGFTMPSHGNLVFNSADKTFAYTPDTGYEGQDQFTYTIRDNRGASATATVTLTVARAVASPVANDDQITTEAGVPITIDVLANDSLPDGQNVGIVAVTLPFKGKLAFNPDKTLTYTPNPGFVGTDDFTYTIGNGKGGTSKATVTIEVTPASSANVYANGYAYRRRIAMPAQGASAAAITDGVILVHERGSWLKSVAHGGKMTHPEGADIRFEDAEGGKLDHEIELYDPEVGKLLAWVRLPNWALGEPLQLSLFYGNPGQSMNEAQPTSVWRGYLARWRLPSGADATGQGYELASQGVAAGNLLGSAALFDGNANLTLTEANWLNDLSALTVQALVKPDAAMLGATGGILVHGSPDSTLWTNGLRLSYLAQTSTGTARVVNFSVRCTDGGAFTLSSGNQHAVERRLIHGTWQSGGAPQLYFDGKKDTPSRSEASAGQTFPISGPLFLGDGWQGLIDEVRIAGRALPPEWIAVEARNMLNPELSYGLGDEETSETVDFRPIAVPFAVSTTSGTRVDIDVLAQAVDPVGVGGLQLTGVGQPLNGIATVVNNAVRYVPNAGFAGTDQFTYTISNSAKSSSGWIAVTVAAATASPPPPPTSGSDPLAVVVVPTAQRVVNVSNSSQLSSALANSQPGDHIVLANGSYSSFNVTRAGTSNNPIVIRAANLLGAVFPGYSINADNIICYGLDSTGGVGVGNNSRAANFRFWRCRIRNGGSQAIRLYTAPDFDAAYSQIGPGWNGRGFLFHATNAPRPVWRYSMFRDSAGSTSGNDGEAMHYSFGPPSRNSAGLVYRCKFKNWSYPDEEELISCKSSGNIFRQLTVENCPGQAINNRFGRNNIYDAIWTNGAGGIGVHDGCGSSGNRVLGCRVENVQGMSNAGIMVRAGQEPPCTEILDGRNAAAGECVVAGCEGPLRIGRTYSNSVVPTRGTRVRQHTGQITFGLHTATDSQPGVAETLYTWSPLIWLQDNDVGPFANL